MTAPAPSPTLTERQADQRWVEETRARYLAASHGWEFIGCDEHGNALFAVKSEPDGR